MELNADFSKRVVLHADEIAWKTSPTPGVHRRMLDRIGDEVARATSIVRYDPDSSFPAHTHGGGEEYVVLEGVFQDERGDFPVGSYVRNPPQSRHTPGSKAGCMILVKLWQFDPADRSNVSIDLSHTAAIREEGRPGVSVTPLFESDKENVRVEQWEPGAMVTIDGDGGAEFFVLEGSFEEGGDMLRRHSWLRVPSTPQVSLRAGPDGARVWIKTGHLRYAAPPSL
jgi:anti-sigma factor ChrR (cupin superfamily)